MSYRVRGRVSCHCHLAGGLFFCKTKQPIAAKNTVLPAFAIVVHPSADDLPRSRFTKHNSIAELRPRYNTCLPRRRPRGAAAIATRTPEGTQTLRRPSMVKGTKARRLGAAITRPIITPRKHMPIHKTRIFYAECPVKLGDDNEERRMPGSRRTISASAACIKNEDLNRP
ncbi:hypothetical protein EXIGLDRAFT_720827, partial [Exidia glandulosa HHB12029]